MDNTLSHWKRHQRRYGAIAVAAALIALIVLFAVLIRRSPKPSTPSGQTPFPPESSHKSSAELATRDFAAQPLDVSVDITRKSYVDPDVGKLLAALFKVHADGLVEDLKAKAVTGPSWAILERMLTTDFPKMITCHHLFVFPTFHYDWRMWQYVRDHCSGLEIFVNVRAGVMDRKEVRYYSPLLEKVLVGAPLASIPAFTADDLRSSLRQVLRTIDRPWQLLLRTLLSDTLLERWMSLYGERSPEDEAAVVDRIADEFAQEVLRSSKSNEDICRRVYIALQPAMQVIAPARWSPAWSAGLYPALKFGLQALLRIRPLALIDVSRVAPNVDLFRRYMVDGGGLPANLQSQESLWQLLSASWYSVSQQPLLGVFCAADETPSSLLVRALRRKTVSDMHTICDSLDSLCVATNGASPECQTFVERLIALRDLALDPESPLVSLATPADVPGFRDSLYEVQVEQIDCERRAVIDAVRWGHSEGRLEGEFRKCQREHPQWLGTESGPRSETRSDALQDAWEELVHGPLCVDLMTDLPVVATTNGPFWRAPANAKVDAAMNAIFERYYVTAINLARYHRSFHQVVLKRQHWFGWGSLQSVLAEGVVRTMRHKLQSSILPSLLYNVACNDAPDIAGLQALHSRLSTLLSHPLITKTLHQRKSGHAYGPGDIHRLVLIVRVLRGLVKHAALIQQHCPGACLSACHVTQALATANGNGACEQHVRDYWYHRTALWMAVAWEALRDNGLLLHKLLEENVPAALPECWEAMYSVAFPGGFNIDDRTGEVAVGLHATIYTRQFEALLLRPVVSFCRLSRTTPLQSIVPTLEELRLHILPLLSLPHHYASSVPAPSPAWNSYFSCVSANSAPLRLALADFPVIDDATKRALEDRIDDVALMHFQVAGLFEAAAQKHLLAYCKAARGYIDALGTTPPVLDSGDSAVDLLRFEQTATIDVPVWMDLFTHIGDVPIRPEIYRRAFEALVAGWSARFFSNEGDCFFFESLMQLLLVMAARFGGVHVNSPQWQALVRLSYFRQNVPFGAFGVFFNLPNGNGLREATAMYIKTASIEHFHACLQKCTEPEHVTALETWVEELGAGLDVALPSLSPSPQADLLRKYHRALTAVVDMHRVKRRWINNLVLMESAVLAPEPTSLVLSSNGLSHLALMAEFGATVTVFRSAYRELLSDLIPLPTTLEHLLDVALENSPNYNGLFMNSLLEMEHVARCYKPFAVLSVEKRRLLRDPTPASLLELAITLRALQMLLTDHMAIPFDPADARDLREEASRPLRLLYARETLTSMTQMTVSPIQVESCPAFALTTAFEPLDIEVANVIAGIFSEADHVNIEAFKLRLLEELLSESYPILPADVSAWIDTKARVLIERSSQADLSTYSP